MRVYCDTDKNFKVVISKNETDINRLKEFLDDQDNAQKFALTFLENEMIQQLTEFDPSKANEYGGYDAIFGVNDEAILISITRCDNKERALKPEGIRIYDVNFNDVYTFNAVYSIMDAIADLAGKAIDATEYEDSGEEYLCCCKKYSDLENFLEHMTQNDVRLIGNALIHYNEDRQYYYFFLYPSEPTNGNMLGIVTEYLTVKLMPDYDNTSRHILEHSKFIGRINTLYKVVHGIKLTEDDYKKPEELESYN